LLTLCVFVSGRGSNLQALFNAIESGSLDARIALVISNRPDAGALELARERGVPALCLTESQFPSPEAFGGHLLETLAGHGTDFIVLAGYLKKIPAAVIHRFRHRIINIHPALLPSFGGKGMYGHHVHEAVLAYGCKVTGATVHLVDTDYDSGAPILQRCVPVLEGDTAESLAARVLMTEHELLPRAVQLFAEDRIRIAGRRVTILTDPGLS
jgi:phosphoribosylglycinamide formyltransferase-1